MDLDGCQISHQNNEGCRAPQLYSVMESNNFVWFQQSRTGLQLHGVDIWNTTLGFAFRDGFVESHCSFPPQQPWAFKILRVESDTETLFRMPVGPTGTLTLEQLCLVSHRVTSTSSVLQDNRILFIFESGPSGLHPLYLNSTLQNYGIVAEDQAPWISAQHCESRSSALST